jgi:hypothetical protein
MRPPLFGFSLLIIGATRPALPPSHACLNTTRASSTDPEELDAHTHDATRRTRAMRLDGRLERRMTGPASPTTC